MQMGNSTTLLSGFSWCFRKKKSEEVHIMTMICWIVWKNRNDLVWNQHSLEANEVVESSFYVLNQWKSVKDKTFDRFMGFMTHDDGTEHWLPPTFNKVKINTDAAIFLESSYYSHAFVIRNHSSDLIKQNQDMCRGGLLRNQLKLLAFERF